MELGYSVSLWNYIHYFPLKKGGTNFAFDRGLGSLEEVVAEVSANGFGVELWPTWCSWEWLSPARSAMEAKPADLFDEVHRERLKTMLEDVRASWHTGNEDTIEEYRRQIDTVSCVGSEILVVHAGNLYLDGPDPDFEFAAQVLDYAREKGVTIALENASDGETEEDPSLWNLPILQRATREFPDLGICLDTTHVQKFARFPMRAYVDALKDRLCHLHVSDAFAADEPFARMHTSPGKGIIPAGDWLHLLETLEEIDFRGEMVLEIIPLSPLHVAREAEEFFQNLAAAGREG